MARSFDNPELNGARDCPFCGCDFLFFSNGAVACDQCEAEGPFCGYHFDDGPDDEENKLEAVLLWNLRGAAGRREWGRAE